MSDILCSWLNRELGLSETVDAKNVSKDFSNGYLFGEILNKYQMQEDFHMFLKSDSSNAKTNNFSRLEPSFKLLGVSFNKSTIQDLMKEKRGVATNLLYQLYVALEEKKPAGISRVVKLPTLQKRESEIHSNQRPPAVSAKEDQGLPEITQDNEGKDHQLDDLSKGILPHQHKKLPKIQDERKLEKSEKGVLQNFDDLILTNAKLLKPLHSSADLRKKKKQEQLREKEVQMVQAEIAMFEEKQHQLAKSSYVTLSCPSDQTIPADSSLSAVIQDTDVPADKPNKVALQSNAKYIEGIRQQLKENAMAREERQKRVDRFLMEQYKARESQQEAQLEEQMVRRLTRQTQQEQRLAEQLMQIRRQKEVILENRLFREEQYKCQRQKDFKEALDKEAVLAQHAKLARAEEIEKEIEFCKMVAAERALEKRLKHYGICSEILGQMIDMAVTVGEYRHITENLVPEKKYKEWKELFVRGIPFYDPQQDTEPEIGFLETLSSSELKKEEVLNNLDYDEYTNMVGVWMGPKDIEETRLPPSTNDILAYAIHRIKGIAHPTVVEPATTVPLFSIKSCIQGKVCQCKSKCLAKIVEGLKSLKKKDFRIKACVLGKATSGKTTSLAKIAEAHGVTVLSPNTLVEEALRSVREGEKAADQQEEKESELLPKSPTPVPSEGTRLSVDGGRPSLDEISRLFPSKLEEKRECINKMASIAALVERELRKGNTIPNELIVDILVEAISQVPAQTGWILDGFPSNITQAQLLEKALGGFVEEEQSTEANTYELVPNPEHLKPPTPTLPVLDVALLLDISDECVVRRASADKDADAAAATTPSQPAGTTTWTPHITHRIAAFQETWPELEKWYGEKQNILVNINADVEEGELYRKVESALCEVMKEQEEAPAEEEIPKYLETRRSSRATRRGRDSIAGLHSDDGLSDIIPRRRSSSIFKSKQVSVDLNEDMSMDNTRSIERRSSGKSISSLRKGKDTRFSDTVSLSTGSIDGLNDSTQPTGSFTLNPLYVNEPLSPQVPEYLCSHWKDVCQSYVNGIKHVMQQLRLQLTLIDRHLFNVRERYNHFLTCPDLKQELVSQWQKVFNSVPDDMREDEETKAELHLRLDELQERLWDITDKRKEEDNQERSAFMYDGWLEEQASLLTNHYSMMIQTEMNRFRETLCTLEVYYWGMNRQIPLRISPKDFSITLLKETGAEDQDNISEPLSSVVKDQMSDKKLPPDTTKSSSKLIENLFRGKLLSDYEEALQAIQTIKDMVSVEFQQREAEVPEEVVEEKETVSKKTSPKSSKKEKQSQKKHSAAPPPVVEIPPPKPPEKTQEQEIREKIYKEFTAAVTLEENSIKARLELVKDRGLTMINSLENKVHETFNKMEKQFESCYLSEMECIDQLGEVVRHHIEASSKLQYELVMEDRDFYLNGDCLLVPGVVLPPRPPPVERSNRSILTIAQLESLFNHLFNMAPSGFMSSSDFFYFFQDLVSNSTGRSIVPEAWTDMIEMQLLEINFLLTDECELIDWRRFLLSATLPWQLPSLSQLLYLLKQYKEADYNDTGYINKEQYLQVELWFSGQSVQKVPEDPLEPLPYNRSCNLQKFFFQMFADHSFSPPLMDYMSMLQYFAASPLPKQGFIRALSIVLGKHLQQPLLSLLVNSLSGTEETAEPTTFKFTEDYKDEDALFSSCSFFKDEEVPISALLNVICHKLTKMGGITLPPGSMTYEQHRQNLENVYNEMGYEYHESVPFSVISRHPYTQMLMETSTNFQLINILNTAVPSR
ncbi:sperm flagellar protein 2 isoform X1 [Poecilia reticulata]|uniref:sperm flagellar protein 2 isoform X1 n=1 Tax=Poecilia reticulata TaxID=8081 RepID=UPI0004A23D33|nr:PREDICTED: sperm flagellar protein 2 isoform X1 [Poecilia reticulata]